MPSRRQLLAALMATPVAAALTGCDNDDPQKPTGGRKFTYLTGFGTSPRESFPYVGVAKGFFTDVGIELTVLPGQPSDGNLKSMAAGQAQFAGVDFVSAVRGSKSFPGYRMVMVVQDTTLLSMITLTGRGITVPADLAGKKLATAPAAASRTLFPSYARLAGFDPARCTFINAPADQLPSLLASGRVDAIGSYAIDTPTVQSAAQGKLPVVLPYSRYLGDLYGTVVLATTGVLASDPELTKRFAGAMARTVRYAVDNPAEAGAIVHSKVPTIKAAAVTTTMGLMKPYVKGSAPDRSRVTRGIAVLATAGLAQSGLGADAVADFTTGG